MGAREAAGVVECSHECGRRHRPDAGDLQSPMLFVDLNRHAS